MIWNSYLQNAPNLLLIIRRYVSKSFSKTLNLPKTSFKARVKEVNIYGHEKSIQNNCAFSELYEWQRIQTRKDEFILHDGPPYANGEPHVGHALNKVMKDITNRYKLLNGYKIHYVPGWDCHGLPIELKVLDKIRKTYKELLPIDIRKKARHYASEMIEIQKKQFEEWGIMADWNKPYKTYDPAYVTSELGLFYEMYENDMIYRATLPVLWSPSSNTAVAEAEIEYKDNHISTSVYVKFPICKLPPSLLNLDLKNIFVVIWTTTPWTLPANKAICFASNSDYSILRDSQGDCYITSKYFKDTLKTILQDQDDLLELCSINGSDLLGCLYKNPINQEINSLLPGLNVIPEEGTGLVHTAPAHGREDYQVALAHDLKLDCLVDEQGLYSKDAVPSLIGKCVLNEGSDEVLQILHDYIICTKSYVHKYPYDWRTKKPLIYRISKQWFINIDTVRDGCLKSLENVNILPNNYMNDLVAHLNKRPYWCISRQRSWGVPLPVFYHKNTNDVFVNKELINHLQTLILKYGCDFWWEMDIESLLPNHILKKYDNNLDCTDFIKSSDVLDIWFDSGSSWITLSPGKKADVYFEGFDQLGGWFQSSLITSVSTQNIAPYDNVIVHGFVVDEHGNKMSKSLGNVINPKDIIRGKTGTNGIKSYGIDTLRWWVGRSHLDRNVKIGSNILEKMSSEIFNVRNTLRYLLGNLPESVQPSDILQYNALNPVDKYMLHMLYKFISQVSESYEAFDFKHVLHLIEQFINCTLSPFYITITKDRVYCNKINCEDRLSALTVQFNILETLSKCISPVVPHIAEEVYSLLPFEQGIDSIFKTKWPSLTDEWFNEDLEHIFNIAFLLSDKFNSLISSQSGLHNDYDVVIKLDSSLYDKMSYLQCDESSSFSPFCELMKCSTLSLKHVNEISDISKKELFNEGVVTYDQTSQAECKYHIHAFRSVKYHCERCRRHTADCEDLLCHRCTDAINDLKNSV